MPKCGARRFAEWSRERRQGPAIPAIFARPSVGTSIASESPVNEDCRPSDRQGQRWPKAQGSKRPHSGATSSWPRRRFTIALRFPVPIGLRPQRRRRNPSFLQRGWNSARVPRRLAHPFIRAAAKGPRRHILSQKGNLNGLSRAFGIRDQDGRCRRIQDLHVHARHRDPRLHGGSDPGARGGVRRHHQRQYRRRRSSAPSCFRSASACSICSASTS